jgi:thiamine transport system substrate-binding protein
LIVATHDSFAVGEDVIAAFEAAQNAKVEFLAMGDAGKALNTIILSKDAPLADLFFGVDNTFLSRALAADVFAPYASPALATVPAELRLDESNRLTPVDYGFVTLNADPAWFAAQGLPLPQTLEDLIKPEYSGTLVVENPATSSPGLAFLLTTIAYFGEDGYLDYWTALRANEVLVTEGWSDAYYTHFTVGSGGQGNRPLVVSYSSSPPADVIFAADGRTEPASVNIAPAGGSFRQIEFAGLLKNARSPELARRFIDFLLSRRFRRTCRCRCSSIRSCPASNCQRSLSSLANRRPSLPDWRLPRSTPIGNAGSKPGPMPFCASHRAEAAGCQRVRPLPFPHKAVS